MHMCRDLKTPNSESDLTHFFLFLFQPCAMFYTDDIFHYLVILIDLKLNDYFEFSLLALDVRVASQTPHSEKKRNMCE